MYFILRRAFICFTLDIQKGRKDFGVDLNAKTACKKEPETLENIRELMFTATKVLEMRAVFKNIISATHLEVP